MKKWCLLFLLLPACAQALCLQFYNDKYGQSHAARCSDRAMPEVECTQKGDFYWDGRTCREIPAIKNCKAQGGEWYEVQIRHDMHVGEVLNNPEGAHASGFRNVCICPSQSFWNGVQCIGAKHIQPHKQCRLNVWCERKVSEVNLLITPEALGLAQCPRN